MNATSPLLATPTNQRQVRPPEMSGKGRFDICANPGTERAVMLLGFDWGTNKSCLKGAYGPQSELAADILVPTLVGYAKDGIVDSLLPDNATVLFGEDAIRHRLHLNLARPMVDGVIQDAAAARDFARHLRALIDAPAGTEIRAVMGMPANADAAARDHVNAG